MVWYGMVLRLGLKACLLACEIVRLPQLPPGPGQHLTLYTRTLRPFCIQRSALHSFADARFPNSIDLILTLLTLATHYLWTKILTSGSLIELFVLFARTLHQFRDAKVVTNLVSTTENLVKAKFPKIVMKNNYEVR